MIKEISCKSLQGIPVVIVLLAALFTAIALLVLGIIVQLVLMIVLGAISIPVVIFLLVGLFMVNPNEARVLQLFGRYVGTVHQEGLRWANPFFSKGKISIRVRNFETERSKVNDADGNPIEIAVVVVWKVVDTAEATFEVDDYENFMRVQSDSAVRNLATQYPYDSRDEKVISLRGNTEDIAEQLKTEIQGRLNKAGLEVLEARITHLAYAPEIASAMLQRQQAGAIIEAREQIVEGAVSIVQKALDGLSDRGVVELDEERKAAMVSNLLVVLCGEKATQPVLNTGSLYQ